MSFIRSKHFRLRTIYDAHNGCHQAYIFRDVKTADGIQVEYGVLSDEGVISWRPCKEGTSFIDIEPFIPESESTL